jgi:hypothetical protein
MTSGTWNNNDGLFIKFGTAEGVSTHPGGTYYNADGGYNITEVVVSLASLTQTETILNDVVWIPANSHIVYVDCFCVVAGATGTAIDVGLIDQDRSTEIDYNGFLAASPAANYSAVGEHNRFYSTHTQVAGLTGTGALIGTEVTNTGYVSASMTDATAFTAGKLRIRIAWLPKGVDVTH